MSTLPRDLAEKIEWCGVQQGEGDYFHTNVIWKRPEEPYTDYGYQPNATAADCEFMESYLQDAYPDQLYTSHGGYCPEDYWAESRVDTALQKQAWYG